MMSQGVRSYKAVVSAHLGTAWVVVISVVQLLAAGSDASPVLRFPVTLLFVLTVPGLVLLDLKHPADRATRAVLGVGASLSTHLVVASLWLAPDPIWILAAIVVVVLGLRLSPVTAAIQERLRERMSPGGRVGAPAGGWVPLHRRGAAVIDELDIEHEPDPEMLDAGEVEPAGSDDEIVVFDVAPSDDLLDRLDQNGLAPIGDAVFEEVGPEPEDWLEGTAEPTASPETPPISGDVVREARPRSDDESSPESADAGQLPSWISDSASSRSAVPLASAAAGPGGEDFVAAAPPIDLNSASFDELLGIPGLGPKLAERIVEYRTTTGGFDRVDRLLDVPGIGDARLRTIRRHVDVLGPASDPQKVWT